MARLLLVGHRRPIHGVQDESAIHLVATESRHRSKWRFGPIGDIAVFYSITSSARVRKVSGIVNPSALAVLG
jgi:hypothetical protein